MSERIFDFICPHTGRFLRTGTYKEYLRSRAWEYRAKQARIRVHGYCQACGRAPYRARQQKRDVHHLTYARLGNELPEDLQVLCRECHQAAHAR